MIKRLPCFIFIIGLSALFIKGECFFEFGIGIKRARADKGRGFAPSVEDGVKIGAGYRVNAKILKDLAQGVGAKSAGIGSCDGIYPAAYARKGAADKINVLVSHNSNGNVKFFSFKMGVEISYKGSDTVGIVSAVK